MSRTSTPPSLLVALMRWLVLAVVWFDLVGSPFHVHRHDLGADHLAVTQAASPHAAGPVLEVPEVLESGHSQAALRASSPAEPQRAIDGPVAGLGPQPTTFAPAVEERQVAVVGLRAAQPPPHWRPASRAPPLSA